MKYLIISACLLLSGCTANKYAFCIDAQKSISKDMVVMEAARVNALIEMTKSADPAVRATAIMMLQKNDAKSISLDCPK